MKKFKKNFNRIRKDENSNYNYINIDQFSRFKLPVFMIINNSY